MEDLNRKCKVLRKFVILRLISDQTSKLRHRDSCRLRSRSIFIGSSISHTIQHYTYHTLYKKTIYGPPDVRYTPLLGSKCYPKNWENILLEKYTECASRKKEADCPASEVYGGDLATNGVLHLDGGGSVLRKIV